jgi:hypothetical protein
VVGHSNTEYFAHIPFALERTVEPQFGGTFQSKSASKELMLIPSLSRNEAVDKRFSKTRQVWPSEN